ncbi:MAG: hypothetical protein J6P03_07240 [Opitutales bacterium]|nr:hypothetical protein [Opitutales bacterium]
MKTLLKTIVMTCFALALGQTYAQDAKAPATPAAPAVQAPAAQVSQPAAPAEEAPVCPLKAVAENFSAELSVGFESQYNFRGLKCAGASFVVDLTLGYNLAENWDIYADAWDNLPLQNSDEAPNELDLSVGTTYNLKGFVFDFGYLYYWYTDGAAVDGTFSGTHELKFGVSYDLSDIIADFSETVADMAITPSVYYFYDLTMHANTVEAAISARIPVSKWILGERHDFLGIEASVYYGFSNIYRHKVDGVVSRYNEGYNYVGGKADLVYTVTDNCALSVGVRYATNDLDPDGKGEQNIWMGAAAKFSY